MGVDQRIRELCNSGVLNMLERDQLTDAYRFYKRLRLKLALLGYTDEIVPENPDKLAVLSRVLNLKGANEVLSTYEEHAGQVRSIYDQCLSRLLSK